MPMHDRVDFHIDPDCPGWYGVICGAGDGEAWTTASYWTGAKWSDRPSFARSRSRIGFANEKEARGWLDKQPD